MAKYLNSTEKKYMFLLDQIEEYIKFVNQVINDKDFGECMRKLLPFDRTARASMTILPEKQVIKKMGIVVMRMNFEPEIFSLAVTMTINKGNDLLNEYTIFLTACKTITELKNYVKSIEFREQILEQCSKKILTNEEIQNISL